MGKKSKSLPIPEETLQLLVPPTSYPIVDTHTHLHSTFETYKKTYPEGKYKDAWEFVRGLYEGRSVEAIVDVWCDAPVLKNEWKALVDSADKKELWGGLEYYFVMGVHPHEAQLYTDEVEKDILEAMQHPRCVGWGEIGLDYHYDNSPREIQQEVLRRQLRLAISLKKPLTIHTREAEEDTERIMKEEVPVDHRIHVHCFTDSPEWAARMLSHFPNLYIGVTGVITYATNLNTSNVIRQMVPIESSLTSPDSQLRILLETDAPFMTPSNLSVSSINPALKNKRFPLCHTAMVPWTAEFVSRVINGKTNGGSSGSGTPANAEVVNADGADSAWDAERVMRVARENARAMYGV
ncbi:hypothetical protein QCA50_004530 [Cerrena zonata]|uniref:Uncharacterized protein n=1 Tax=Cerrena zonata TaxID=2478898 RepID=A0AAW0GHX8_9APHY